MYQWLANEIAAIRTPKFHVVDGPAGPDLRQAVEASTLPLPDSYTTFVLLFGNARLYRAGSGYLVGVRAYPVEAQSSEGTSLRCIGHYDDAQAYLRGELLAGRAESPVFEWSKAGLRQVSDGFAPWLESRCKAARRRFAKKDWQTIVRGPRPFTPDEEAIVAARRGFTWRVVSVRPTNEVDFEVVNASDRVLPYLSVGIRQRNGSFVGAAWLRVDSIPPGSRAVVTHTCYAGLVPSEDLEAFSLPDPGPEDRERYWEFRR